MKIRFAVAIALLAALSVIVLLLRAAPSNPVGAQSESPQPLLFTEIAHWCPAICSGMFSDVDGGYVRFVIDGDSLYPIGWGCEPMLIPEGIEGWAYVQTKDTGLSTEPTYPANPSTMDVISADATSAALLPESVGFEVLTIEQSRANPMWYCELIVRRTSR